MKGRNHIQELRDGIGKGARANKFEIQFHPLAFIPATKGLRDIGRLLAKASTFPGKSIPMVEAFLRGRKTILQGSTDYGNTWEVTFYEKLDHSVRMWFLLWMSLIDDDLSDTHNYQYFSSANVTQLDINGEDATTGLNHYFGGGHYTLLNCWPQSVGEMAIDSSNPSSVGEFTVTFAFDMFTPLNLQIGKSIGF